MSSITLPEDKTEDELILNCYNIIFVPIQIYNFKNLTKLYLGNNKIYKLEAHFFLNLTRLEELDLSYNGLKIIPEIISLLSKLKLLYLNGNKLYSIPETVYDLPELEYLNISNNRMYKLSKKIYKPKKLHTINVSYNQITTLPIQIINCKKLTNLNVSYNQIYYLNPKVKTYLETITTII